MITGNVLGRRRLASRLLRRITSKDFTEKIGLNLLFEGKKMKARRYAVGGYRYCYLISVEQKVFYFLAESLYLLQLHQVTEHAWHRE